MNICGPSPPRILQIHSVHQVASGTPSYVSLRRHGIIIAIFRGFGANCMVLSDWDLAPSCVCGPKFTSYLIGNSAILSAASIEDSDLYSNDHFGESSEIENFY